MDLANAVTLMCDLNMTYVGKSRVQRVGIELG